MKMSTTVLDFAKRRGLEGLMAAFADYWDEKRSISGVKGLSYSTVDSTGKSINFSQKENALNTLFAKEVARLSNVDFSAEFGMAHLATNPNVLWTAFAIVDQLVEMILPVAIIDSIGMYTDVRTGGWGDSFKFTVKPNDLFPVTKASRGKRIA